MEAKPVTAVCCALFFLSMIVCIPGAAVLDNTIGWKELIVPYLGGAIILIGVPLCWFFGNRKYYGSEFRAERFLVWIMLFIIVVCNTANIVILVNACCGKKEDTRLIRATIGRVHWNGRRGVLIMDFEAPGVPVQSLDVMPKAKEQLLKSSGLMIKAHSGGLGYLIIDSYSFITTNSLGYPIFDGYSFAPK